jgi:RNA polymerase-binding transcription factor DksA
MKSNSDSIDNASDQEMAFREAAIREALKQKPPPKDFDGKHCVECGVAIPKLRLDLGKYTCVDCQSYIERKSRFYK